MRTCFLIGLAAFLIAVLDPFLCAAQPEGGAVDGDFNSDGAWDCLDVDALTTAIANFSSDLLFDMTGDGLVNTEDRDEWLSVAGQENLGPGLSYLIADADLDGVVDASDFNIWNLNKFTVNTAWCSGNFNADGVIDTADFNLWNLNKFQASGSVSTIPEPSGFIVVAITLLGLAVVMRRR